MYCSRCGVENNEGASNCVNCGRLLGAVPAQPFAVQVQPAVISADAQTCGLAMASFIMGLLCMTCVMWPFLGLPAIICGIIALVKIGNSKGQLKGNGLAIAGIVIPAVFTLVVPILMAILMPALGKTKTMAERVVCGTNLKGLSMAMRVYANDYDDRLPVENWCDLLIEEVDVHPKSLVCPRSEMIEGECSYAMNKNIAGMKLSDLPATVVLFFETDMGIGDTMRDASIQTRRHYEFLNEFDNVYDANLLVYKDCFNQLGGPEDLSARHDSGRPGCNIAFADGHVEFVTEDRLADLQWAADQ